MTGYTICAAAVMVLGMGPALLIASRGSPVVRLVGVELISATAVVALLLISQVVNQSYDLIVPFVLVPMSFAGTLVFTRLLSKTPDENGDGNGS